MHLVLLVFIADNGEAASAQQILLHELPARLKVGAQSDADQRQVPAGREEVTAFQEARRLYVPNYWQPCRAAATLFPCAFSREQSCQRNSLVAKMQNYWRS